MYTNITPEWAKGFEKAESCAVIRDGDSDQFFVLDHGIQTTLATGTEKECWQFLHTLDPRICVHCGQRRMWDGGGYYCPACDDGVDFGCNPEYDEHTEACIKS